MRLLLPSGFAYSSECGPFETIQAFQSVAFAARQPTVHRPPRNAPIPGHLVDRPTVPNYRQDRLVPLLSHAHLPHARERDKSAEVAVTHQPKAFWDLSAELAHEIGSGVGIRTLNLAVNRSAQPVQKSRSVFAECRHVSRLSTWCRQRCCTRRLQRSGSGASLRAISAIRRYRPNTPWSAPASIASLRAQLEGPIGCGREAGGICRASMTTS